MKEKARVRIRLATHKDALNFLKVEALCFEMKPNRDTIYFWTPAVSYLWSYKAEIGNRIVGGIVAMPTRHGYWYVNSLFVHPRYRRHGIATKLLSKIIKQAEGKKILLDVKTNKKFLHEFYRNHGFTRKRMMKNYYHDGTDRYLLVRA